MSPVLYVDTAIGDAVAVTAMITVPFLQSSSTNSGWLDFGFVFYLNFSLSSASLPFDTFFLFHSCLPFHLFWLFSIHKQDYDNIQTLVCLTSSLPSPPSPSSCRQFYHLACDVYKYPTYCLSLVTNVYPHRCFLSLNLDVNNNHRRSNNNFSGSSFSLWPAHINRIKEYSVMATRVMYTQ